MCKIDYETYTVSFVNGQTETILPMEYKQHHVQHIKIPARTEMVVPINIKINSDQVVLNKEIQEGIFISNTIIPHHGVKHIRILNSTDSEIKIKNIEDTLEIHPLKDYTVKHIKKGPKINHERFKQLITKHQYFVFQSNIS